jgi:hypothetical protein
MSEQQPQPSKAAILANELKVEKKRLEQVVSFCFQQDLIFLGKSLTLQAQSPGYTLA